MEILWRSGSPCSLQIWNPSNMGIMWCLGQNDHLLLFNAICSIPWSLDTLHVWLLLYRELTSGGIPDCLGNENQFKMALSRTNSWLFQVSQVIRYVQFSYLLICLVIFGKFNNNQELDLRFCRRLWLLLFVTTKNCENDKCDKRCLIIDGQTKWFDSHVVSYQTPRASVWSYSHIVSPWLCNVVVNLICKC